MKRKLDEHNVPAASLDKKAKNAQSILPMPESLAIEIADTHDVDLELGAESLEEDRGEKLRDADTTEQIHANGRSFDEFGLDTRLLKAVARNQFVQPTAVQKEAIPAALAGQSLLLRAKTGTGKTAAYLLPVLQQILKTKSEAQNHRCSALILVPTKELAAQVSRVILTLTSHCPKDVQAVNLALPRSEQAQRVQLASSPNIIVSTPARVLPHLRSLHLSFSQLRCLVVDEVDLILSYGYEEDFQTIVELLPATGIQTIMASATLNADVVELREKMCQNVVLIDVQDEDGSSASKLNQYVVKCAEDEKFLLIFAVLKLKLIYGKRIIFVADTDRAVRLKLFLMQFGLKSCVLNSELPVNSRTHIVDEFNKGVYETIIASDEHEVVGSEAETQSEASNKDVNGDMTENGQKQRKTLKSDRQRANTQKSKTSKRKRDREYGVSRGIDFRNVTCVINFDLPPTRQSYLHRIGRTARAFKPGTALSFVIPTQLYRKHKHTTHPCAANDEAVLAAISEHQVERGEPIQPYAFDMTKLEGFRYRVASALKAVTPGAVHAARIAELKAEMRKSERLKRHLEENPADAQYLRHDEDLSSGPGSRKGAMRLHTHLRHVPEYLMPQGLPAGDPNSNGKDAPSQQANGPLLAPLQQVSFRRVSENKIRKARERNRAKGKGKRGAPGGRRADPLRTFNAKGRK